MSTADGFLINQKHYHSIRQAAAVSAYSTDYLTRLAREQKIRAFRRGRRWYVDLTSVEAYATIQQQEQTIRQKQLRAARQHELRIGQLQQEQGAVLAASRPERQVVLAVVALALFGVALAVPVASGQGSPFSAAPQAALPAAAVAAVSPAAVPTDWLQPEFSHQHEAVSVTAERAVSWPGAAGQWTYLEYE